MFAPPREELKGIDGRSSSSLIRSRHGASAPRPRSSESARADGDRTVIFGQTQVVEEALVTLLAGGHGLLVGVPGLAKTKLVETLGTVLGLDARRVQFTPDLMPADILGSEVLEETATAPQLPFRARGRSSRNC